MELWDSGSDEFTNRIVPAGMINSSQRAKLDGCCGVLILKDVDLLARLSYIQVLLASRSKR